MSTVPIERELLEAEIERLRFALDVAKTDELSAAVWAETELLRHDLWEAKAAVDQLRASVVELEAYQADHNYDMDRARMTGLLRNAMVCLEEWNMRHPRVAKRGDEGSSEFTYRQIREYLEFDALNPPQANSQEGEK